jgi:hypothetical protein
MLAEGNIYPPIRPNISRVQNDVAWNLAPHVPVYRDISLLFYHARNRDEVLCHVTVGIEMSLCYTTGLLYHAEIYTSTLHLLSIKNKYIHVT